MFFNLNTENSLYAHILHNTPLITKASFLPERMSQHILRSWNDNKGDCWGSHVPAWCAGAHRPAAAACHRAQPRRGPGPGPPAGATRQGRSQGSSQQRCSSHTWHLNQHPGFKHYTSHCLVLKSGFRCIFTFSFWQCPDDTGPCGIW